MEKLFPGIIMAFREGLEALLIITVIIKFLEKTNNHHLKKQVGLGVVISVLISSVIGLVLFSLFKTLSNLDNFSKLWESVFSLLAVGLIITFILWIIKKGQNIKRHIEDKTEANLSKKGIVLLTTFLIAREGVEIIIFALAGKYQFFSIIIGIILAMATSIFIYLSFIKINLKKLFNITLFYLIIQAGYLFGYGIHEGLSALLGLGFLEKNSFLLLKLFDLSKTVLSHKEGIIGILLNILLGWYSKPEWIQFVAQYLVTINLFLIWLKQNRSIYPSYSSLQRF